MAYTELGITVIQQFTAANGPVAVPLLPLLVYGPGYNVQSRATHSTPEEYDGGAKSISYPNLGTEEFVDLGTQETWGENEVAYPVSVFITDGKKVIDSDVAGYFASTEHYAGTKTGAAKTITGFAAGTFNLGDIGKAIYIHTGVVGDRGARNITAVNGTGTEITVDGAVFNVGESANISVTPTGGQVSRFYSAGNLSNVRVGDLIELGPAYTTTFEVSALGAGNYVDLTTSTAPTGNDQQWRATAEFNDVAISNTQTERSVELTRITDFTYDKNGIDLKSGLADSATPSGPIVSGNIKVSYRAVKTLLAASTGKIEEDSEVATKVGVETEYNPLAFALGKARENTTFTVYFTGADVTDNVRSGATDFDGPGKLDYADQLARVADEDMYVLNSLSQYTGHNTELNTHVTDVSDPNKQWNRVRIGIINTALSTETEIAAEGTFTTWDVNGLTTVQNSNDGQLYWKSGRISSRGGNEFPNFDGSTSPLPVNSKTDLTKLSGGTVSANNGFWGMENAEVLPVRDSGNVSEEAPYRGFVAGYGGRIRSGTFQLTASDNGGNVRLTAPSNGAFRFLEGVAIGGGLASRMWLPGVRNGIICNVTAVDTSNYVYVDTNIPYDAAYNTALGAQICINAYDAIFATPGLTLTRRRYTTATGSTTSGTDTLTGPAGFFTNCVGLQVSVSGTTAAADDGYHEIVSVNGTGTEAVVATNLTTNDAGSVTINIDLVQIAGAAGKNEFASVSASETGTLTYAGNDFALTGNKKNATKNLDGFPAGTFGPGDVGRTLMFYEALSAVEFATITAFVSDTEVETDASVNFTGPAAVTVQICDQDYSAAEAVTVYDQIDDDNITVALNWAQKYAGNNVASATINSVQYGYGDLGRVVRILAGAYSGQSYTVYAVRGEELILTNDTAFGTGATLGADSSAEDQNGFGIEFTVTPGNNAFRLSQRGGYWPEIESGKTYIVQRDFRQLEVTGETFITKGVVNGSILRITSPSSLAGDYEVDTVPAETRVTFKAGSELPLDGIVAEFDGGSLASLKYELVQPKTKDQQAQTIADYAASFANRRLICVWPDKCVMPVDGNDTDVPGYYLGTIVGAFISGFPPQRPLSRTAMTGVSSLKNSKVDNYFKRSHLNTMAGGGVMIIHMEDDTDVPHIRHQLSTDMSDIKFQEVSITKIVDYITRVIKQEFDPYLGKYNIGDLLISKLKTTAQAIVQFCENQVDAKAGPLVNEIEFTSIAASATVADEVEAEVVLDVPVPFNRLTVTVRA